MAIWYYSFSEPAGWLGCVHTEADDFMEGLEKLTRLDLNPGGEVVGFPMDPRTFEDPRGQKSLQVLDQFLDKAACEAIWGKDEMTKIPMGDRPKRKRRARR